MVENIKLYQSFVVATQIPVLLFLCVLSYQVSKSLKKESFKWLTYAWFTNFTQLILVYLIGNSGVFTPQEAKSFQVISFIALVDVASSYFFYLAGVSFVTNKQDKNASIKNVGVAVLLIAYATFYSVQVSRNTALIEGEGINLFYIPIAAFSAYALFLITKNIRNPEGAFRWSRALIWGFGGYAVIQILAVFTKANSTEIQPMALHSGGFTLGVIFKSVILYGMHRVFVFAAEEKMGAVQMSENLNRILGRTFHEITAPLKTIHSKLNRIENPKSRDDIHMSSEAKRQIAVIESNYNRVIAVISAAMKVYEEDIIIGHDYEPYERIYAKRFSPNNINALIEVAIISLKDVVEDEESFTIHREYSKGCNTICYPEEIVQVLYNLLKNSVDSFAGRNGAIFVKTTVFRKGTDKSMRKFVRLQVADDGPGIPTDIQTSIFQEGFSTKDKTSRGYGLFIAKDLTEKNNGSIEVESPYQFTEFRADIKSGSLFTLTFEAY